MFNFAICTFIKFSQFMEIMYSSLEVYLWALDHAYFNKYECLCIMCTPSPNIVTIETYLCMILHLYRETLAWEQL